MIGVKEYHSQEELFEELIPAMNVKISMLKKEQYYDVKYGDIWNYLIENKWRDSVDLTLGEMVHDIIHADSKEIMNYINNIEGNV